jgi:hypothetical protein
LESCIRLGVHNSPNSPNSPPPARTVDRSEASTGWTASLAMRQSKRFADLKLPIGHTRAAERQRALPAATSAVNQSATVDHHELEELRHQTLQLYIEAHERRQPAERSAQDGRSRSCGPLGCAVGRSKRERQSQD